MILSYKMNNANISLFEDLTNADKTTRERAENSLKELKITDLNTALLVFEAGMNCEKAHISQLATLLLKKTYFDDNEFLSKLNPDNIIFFKSFLAKFLNFDKDFKFLQRLGEIYAKLYSVSDLNSSFSEILSFLNSSNVNARRYAIFLIETLSDYEVLNDQIVKNSLQEFKSIFQKGLADEDLKVKTDALKAATQFLSNLKEQDNVKFFADLLDSILETLIFALKADPEKGKNALEALNTLTDEHPKLWKGKLETLIEIISQIAKEIHFSNDIRESALEIIYTLSSKTPAFIRKSPNFKNIFLILVFELLLDVDNKNNLNKWDSQTEEDELELKEMYFGARDAINRLSSDLGGKFMVENSMALIPQLLSSDDWIKVHAGLIALGFMTQGCKDLFKTNILEVLKYISTGLDHTNPRVRYAALTALGMLCEELAPTVQKKFHSNIIPALCKLMSNEESSVRVKTQSCSALVNFLRGLSATKVRETDNSSNVINNYSNDLINVLSQIFEYSLTVNYSPLQEESLTALSLLATILDKDFAPFYSKIMPGLKQIFYKLEPKTQQEATLKSHAIETISYLCSSVSEDCSKFIEDFKELSSSFIILLRTLKEEDPQVIAILNAFTHISTSMREQFFPYLNDILPILEQYINTNIDFKLEDADLKEYVNEEADSSKASLTVKFAGLEKKKISMNTHALQNKIMAMTVLHELCLNMNTSFAPYLERYMKISKSVLEFPYSRKIRKIAAKGLYASILVCQDDQQRRELITYLGTDIVKVFNYATDSGLLREIKMLLKVLTTTADEITNPNVYNEEFILSLYGALKKAYKLVEEKKVSVNKVGQGEEFDENDNEAFQGDFDFLNEIRRRIMELNGLIFKVVKEPLTPIIKNALYDEFMQVWKHGIEVTKDDEDILPAICFFCDYLNYSDQNVKLISNF